MPRSRKSAPPELTPEQRQRQIVMILSTGLVGMSPAMAGPPDSIPPDPAVPDSMPPNSGPENTLESSQNQLDLSRKTRLIMSTG